MARTRMLKPGFFTNDTLAALPPIARLLFAGLWGIADREGRLEDRPTRIKAEVLPYDRANVDELLAKLQSSGFVVRYEVEGERYIQIRNFARHQSPHVKEPTSTIPAPPCTGESGSSTGQVSDSSGASPSLDRSDTDTDTDPLTDTDNARPRAPRHKPVDEEFIAEMVREFAGVLDEPRIRRELETAKNRRQWDDYRDKRKHFHDWLERTAGYSSTRQNAGAGVQQPGVLAGNGTRPGEAFPAAKRWPPDE